MACPTVVRLSQVTLEKSLPFSPPSLVFAHLRSVASDPCLGAGGVVKARDSAYLCEAILSRPHYLPSMTGGMVAYYVLGCDRHFKNMLIRESDGSIGQGSRLATPALVFQDPSRKAD